MKKAYAVLNLVVLLGVVVWNYLSNTGFVSENTVGDLSAEYANLFTPAGYAFSIWGLIFLWLLALCIYMVVQAFSNREGSDWILRLGPWLIAANVGNAAWLWFWLTEQTLVSTAVRHWGSVPTLQWTAVVCAGVIGAFIVLGLLRGDVARG